MSVQVTNLDLSIWRGDARGGEMVSYRVPVREGMVVLDAVLWVQANMATDLAVRAACIGSVQKRGVSAATIRRALGREQPLDEPSGALLPRIC